MDLTDLLERFAAQHRDAFDAGPVTHVISQGGTHLRFERAGVGLATVKLQPDLVERLASQSDAERAASLAIVMDNAGTQLRAQFDPNRLSSFALQIVVSSAVLD